MKKTLLLFAAMLTCFGAMAKPVDATMARRVATTQMNICGNTAQLTDVTGQTTFANFYIFTAEGGGFVLVSGDDCVVPILGFSATATFDARRIPANVLDILQQYEDEIAYWKEMEGLQANSDWQPLLFGVAPDPVAPTAVAPLLTTTWDQEPYYNNMCPGTNSARAVTGCVATATAQIMKKWNHPATGYGSHSYSDATYGTLSANFGNTTYQWSSMPNALSATSSTAQVNAVATLMYHIGVANEAEYGVDATSASNYNYFGYIDVTSENSLQRYFKYRSDMAAIAREDYSNAEYIALLKGDLDAGRPILYSGRDASAGHSFVCDGYNNSNQFHINWGWGGYYNGYFAIGSLNPDGGGTGSNTGSYNLQNVALIRIQPNNSWSSTGTTTVSATATGGTGCSVNGGGSYSFGDTVHLQAIAATGYHFTGWSDGCKFNPRQFIANGGTLSFTAQFEPLGGDTITYCPGNRYLTSLGATSGTSTWGIRIPASALTSGNALTSVQFYATATGSHTLTIYSGTSSPTTSLYTTTVNITSTGWRSISTGSVTPTSGQDLWIVLSSSASYPAAMSYSGGHNYGLLWGTSMTYAGYSQCSWMIRGIFGTGSTPTPVNDTCLITTFPYTENFDNSATYGCLRLINANNDTVTWSLINGYGYNSTICAYIMYAEQADDYLVLPGIATPGNYTVTWKAKAYNASYPETYQVYAGDTMIFSETLSTTTFVSRTATFSVAAGDTVNLMFRYISDDMYAFFLDDITITQGNTPPTQYTITVASNNSAWGSVSGGGTYNAGATATLTATPNSGYRFVQWQDGVATNPRTVTVTANATYTATFAANSTPATTDTISYCGNAAIEGNLGTDGGDMYWGIRIPAATINGHNYLKSVMLYVNASYTGQYTLKVYRTGTSAPGTLAHTQVVNLTTGGWNEILLDNQFALTNQDLWITFYTTGLGYPAAYTTYNGDANSDWLSLDGTQWAHAADYDFSSSWMIKAVTTQTAPSLPAPTVTIDGPAFTATGVAQTFNASASGGATVTWSLAGATPATATGNSVTATWYNPGTYNVIATATNANGTSNDTLTVNVVNCGTITTFPYTLTFEPSDINLLACWTTVDADGDGYSWTTTPMATVTGSIGSASYINNIGVLTPDNWLISPQMQFTTGSNYTLTWKTWALDATYYEEHYGVYVSTTGTATSNFSLVQQYTMTTADTTAMTLDLSAYAGQTVYIAFRHWNVSDVYWMMLDDISITQTAIPGQNYTITVQSANPTMGSVSGGGTYTAGSNVTISATPNSGYHFVQWNDGNTNATRTVTVTGNATYIASFASDAPTQYTLTVLANNNAWGSVSGGGTYNAGATATLTATPNSGYRFVQWSDGNTNATRTVTVNADATYIATFEAGSTPQQYTITVLANNDSWGNVTGGGTYAAGSSVTINAMPYNGYTFVQWNDGVTTAQRTITVTADATYIATFAQNNGIDDAVTDAWTIYPNPANDAVSIMGIAQGQVSISDLTGRTVATYTIAEGTNTIDVGNLSAGAYFVRITSGNNSAVRKLIIK